MWNRRSAVFLGLAALILTGLVMGIGCGGHENIGNTNPIPLDTLSFANADSVLALIEQAEATGVLSPQLQAIIDGVNAALTPAEQVYLDSLFSEDDTDAQVEEKVNALIDQLVTEQGDDFLFNAPPELANDLDRLEQVFKALSLQGGLATPGPQEIALAPSSSLRPLAFEAQAARCNQTHCQRRVLIAAQRLYREEIRIIQLNWRQELRSLDHQRRSGAITRQQYLIAARMAESQAIENIRIAQFTYISNIHKGNADCAACHE